MKVILICLLAILSFVTPQTVEDDGDKGRLYKLIGGVHNGGHDYEHHHYHKCNCTGAPGPPGPPGFPGVPGIPGTNGLRQLQRDEYDYNRRGPYDDYDYGYNKRYSDYRPYYRDEKPPRDFDYRDERRPIPPPPRRDRDYERYDAPVHPHAVVDRYDAPHPIIHDDRDIRVPDDAPDSDFEKRYYEARSFPVKSKFKLVSKRRNPFVSYARK